MKIVGTLDEIIDDDHAIVSYTSGPEHYVGILSFVDKDLLEPGCSVLLHQKVDHFNFHFFVSISPWLLWAFCKMMRIRW